tara:strand:- start:21126 stop:21797 length:672 start_codon:yes stop_codon:yes gene_type:complete
MHRNIKSKRNKQLLNDWNKVAQKAKLFREGNSITKSKLLALYMKHKKCSKLTANNHFMDKQLDEYFTRPTDRSNKGQQIKLLFNNGYPIISTDKEVDNLMYSPAKMGNKKMPKKQKLEKEVKELYKKVKDNYKVNKMNESQKKISNKCEEIKSFLLQKNEQYGDSVLTPIRIFSKADDKEQLRVRIDDKLNRLLQGNASIEKDEDVIKDLIGYLVLLLVSMES